MSVRVHREENAIYFLTDIEGHKLDEIEQFPNVSLAWADGGNYEYVLVAGKARL